MDKKAVKREAFSIAKDITIAVVFVGILLGSIVAYTGNWPPLVVIESGSMMHTEGNSIIGAIDPGDLVLVKKIDDRGDVTTYVEGAKNLAIRGIVDDGENTEVVFERTMDGRKAPHDTYDEPGDVIIYYKNGDETDTPIIHRAILWVEYNQENDSFDIPDIGLYDFKGKLEISPVGYRELLLTIDLETILNAGFRASGQGHDGYITLGDHNSESYDQAHLFDMQGNLIEPVDPSWVLGKARGELPWFGALKLYFGDEGDSPTVGKGAVPPNSWRNLYLTIGGLIGLAISLDLVAYLISSHKKKKEELADDEKEGVALAEYEPKEEVVEAETLENEPLPAPDESTNSEEVSEETTDTEEVGLSEEEPLEKEMKKEE